MNKFPRISIGDGKYCYSGPDCQWHSARGIAKVRKELRLANEELLNAKTLDDMVYARERVSQATDAYDMTVEGLADLTRQINHEDDPVQKNILTERKRMGVLRAERSEADKANPFGEGTLRGFIKHPHTYKIEEPDIDEDHHHNRIVTGYKYDANAFHRVEDIQKLVKSDLKEAQAKGYLPAHLKFSVRKVARQMVVEVQGVTDAEQFYVDINGNTLRSPESVELRKRVELITHAYNRSSKAWHEHPLTAYDASVTIETDSRAEHRAKETLIGTQKRKSKPALDEIKTIVANSGSGGLETYMKIKQLKFDNFSADSYQFTLTENNHLLFKNRETKEIELYDMNNYDIPDRDNLVIHLRNVSYRTFTNQFRNSFVNI